MLVHTRSQSLIVGLAITLLWTASFGATATAAEPAIHFYSLDEGKQAIIDESLEPYFSLLQPLEMTAKTGAPITGDTLDAQRDECRHRYQNMIQEYSDADKDMLSVYVRKVHATLETIYPLFAAEPWAFVKVDAGLEGGLPHTRGKVIVFSDAFLTQFRHLHEQAGDAEATRLIGNILIHEQMHVFQRTHPKVVANLYTELWKFERADTVTGLDALRDAQLVNPDGVDCRWIFPLDTAAKRYVLPLIIFKDGQEIRRMPQDFRMIGVDVTLEGKTAAVVTGDDGQPVVRDLLSIREYTGAFAGSHNIYHPNETLADLFPRLVVWDHLTDKSKIPPARVKENDQSLKPLRDWCAKHLAKAK